MSIPATTGVVDLFESAAHPGAVRVLREPTEHGEPLSNQDAADFLLAQT